MHRLLGSRRTVGVLCSGMTLLGVGPLLAGYAIGQPPSAAGGPIQVVVAEDDWGSIAAQVGGDRVQVTSLIRNPDADPHDDEPTTAHGRAVAICGPRLVQRHRLRRLDAEAAVGRPGRAKRARRRRRGRRARRRSYRRATRRRAAWSRRTSRTCRGSRRPRPATSGRGRRPSRSTACARTTRLRNEFGPGSPARRSAPPSRSSRCWPRRSGLTADPRPPRISCVP